LNIARQIYNYRLTQARRMVECAFGTVCNKWRVFHCVTDVCPDFYDVTVKTCCILHNFFQQTDSFQSQDTLYKCPLKSIKVLSIEIMLQKRIWGGEHRGWECLSVGELAGG
jgi:hypothetical protein